MVYIHITQVTSPRALQTTSGWADSNAVIWNAVVGHALTLMVDSLRVGAAAEKRVVLQVWGYIHLNDQITTRPQAVGLGGLYSW